MTGLCFHDDAGHGMPGFSRRFAKIGISIAGPDLKMLPASFSQKHPLLLLQGVFRFTAMLRASMKVLRLCLYCCRSSQLAAIRRERRNRAAMHWRERQLGGTPLMSQSARYSFFFFFAFQSPTTMR